ncbi:MAG: strawberry notch C-terminal domain-containing protein [Desulfopila sp.]
MKNTPTRVGKTGYAADAVQQLISNVHRGAIQGIDMPTLVRELGLPNLVDEHGQLNSTQIPTVPRFLNRILRMKIDMQNRVFDLFSNYLDANVTRAEENGTLDVGLETLRAKSIHVVDKQPVYTDQKSGAVTEYVQLDVEHQVEKRAYDPRYKVAVNNKSGMPWQVIGEKSVTNEAGEVVEVMILRNGRSAVRNAPKADFKATFQVIASNKEAREIWKKGLDAIPDTVIQREHLITGALLPIWDKLIGHPKIVRVQTGKETMLGRMIPGEHVSEVMALLDVEGKTVSLTPEQAQDIVLRNGQTLTFDNKWKITRRRVAGENRMEVEGTDYGDYSTLNNYGAFTERINYVTRNFIPVGEVGNEVLERILKNHKVLTVSGKAKDNPDDIRYSSKNTGVSAVNLEVIGEATDERSIRDGRILQRAVEADSARRGAGKGQVKGTGRLTPVKVQPELEQAAQALAGVFGKRIGNTPTRVGKT